MIINSYIFGPSIDPDAQAFITAASITDPTQQSAINTLVTDLKGYGVWTKMKAVYPFVGGTAAQHKWNLKDPRDLDAAFRIFWNGGVTHSSNGVQFGGVNGWANTYCNPESNLGLQSNHLSFYSRTQVSNTNSHDIGAQTGIGGGPGGTTINFNLFQYFNAVSNKGFNDGVYPTNATLINNNNTLGFQIGSRTSINSLKLYFNNSLLNTNTISKVSSSYPNYNIYIGATNSANTASEYSSKQCAFASIGDGLTDIEAANFYTAVQAFQTTLGRSIGTQTVSDADAQAFVTNAGIVDQVEANAINTLVIGLKADSLWTKMKAVYPFVGGSSSTMKYNLKNPLDTDAAFRLVFNGGWTFSQTGALPNGTNAFADTFFNPNTSASLNSNSLSYYSRTNATNAAVEIGVGDNNTGIYNILELRTTNTTYFGINSTVASYTDSDSRGLYLANRQASNDLDLWKQGVKVVNGTTASSSLLNGKIYLGAMNSLSIANPQYYSTKECAFASIGDGLTDTDATNLNTRVTTFQTALNRNV